MRKWSFLAAGLGWVLAVIYEWMWRGGSANAYLGAAVIGATVAVALFVRDSMSGDGDRTRPMIWFLLAALTAALFYAALGRTVEDGLTHVPMLPMYIVLFLDFFLTGCYLWWKKLKKR